MLQSSFESQYAAAADSVLHSTGREAFDAVRMLKNANLGQYTPANGADYPRSAFGEALRQIAQLVKADVGLEVAFAESGNWDHHVNEGAAVGILDPTRPSARGVDGTRARSRRSHAGRRRSDHVGVRTCGGRERKSGNRSRARQRDDDYWRSGPRGKVYGRWPGLAPEQRYERRDLAVTTDFRSVFAEVVHGHLGLADTRPVFPGFTAQSTLGFV